MEKLSVVPKHIDFCNNAISRESVVYLMLKVYYYFISIVLLK